MKKMAVAVLRLLALKTENQFTPVAGGYDLVVSKVFVSNKNDDDAINVGDHLVMEQSSPMPAIQTSLQARRLGFSSRWMARHTAQALLLGETPSIKV